VIENWACVKGFALVGDSPPELLAAEAGAEAGPAAAPAGGFPDRLGRYRALGEVARGRIGVVLPRP